MMAGAGRRALAASAALSLLALGACSVIHRGEDLFTGGEKPPPAGPIYSPNGEPLSGGPLGNPSCADAMGRWFGRVDAEHKGTIDLTEFLADARRQFAAMDLDHSGVLTPAVLAQYRAPYIAEERARQTSSDDDTDEHESARRRQNGDAPIAQDRPDPVMLADTKLLNRVTLDEFLAYANSNFTALDRDKTGRLDRDDVIATCPKT